ncbi:hypothetical protein ACWEKM_16560 [Streptomyces sp. NPDC004752]
MAKLDDAARSLVMAAEEHEERPALSAEIDEIFRRRLTVKEAGKRHLAAARRIVALASVAGIEPLEAAELTGYALRTCTKWAARRGRAEVSVEQARAMPCEQVRLRLRQVGVARQRQTEREQELAQFTAAVAATARRREMSPVEFAAATGYTVHVVESWYETARKVAHQAARNSKLTEFRLKAGQSRTRAVLREREQRWLQARGPWRDEWATPGRQAKKRRTSRKKSVEKARQRARRRRKQ